MNPSLLRAVLHLPYDVFVDNILPRVFEPLEPLESLDTEAKDLIGKRNFPVTPRELLVEVLRTVRDVYDDSENYELRVQDLYASLLHHFSAQLLLDVLVSPRPDSVQGLFLSDCEQLCCSSDPGQHPTLIWKKKAHACQGQHLMATTLLASQTGVRVILSVDEVRIQGNSLTVHLKTVKGKENAKGAIGSEQASVASLAVVARRGGSRVGTSYGELVLGKRGFFYQEARDALEASRFTMSEIKSLSSTTSVTYQDGGAVVVDFPDIMESLSESGGTGEELLLTVGACFVGLDLVHHTAYYPVRLGVLEELIQARRDSGQDRGGAFSRLNRLDCDRGVLAAWEKRML